MLKEIRINNYRIFGGNHHILLSMDDARPFTVVSTINASGKTTMVDAVLWCFGESLRWSSKQNLLNLEVEQSLSLGETTEVSIELIFEIQKKTLCFKRVACLRKNFNDSSVYKEDFYFNERLLPPKVYREIIEKQFPYWRLMITMWDERMSVQDFSRRLQKEVYYYTKNVVHFSKLFECIEAEANSIFDDLCSRSVRFKLKWNKELGFDVLIMHDGKWESYCPSTTFVVRVNVAIAIATYRILTENNPMNWNVPFIVDDFLMGVAKNQFSINEICALMYPTQTLFLLHQNSLEGLSSFIANKFGKQYSMICTRDYTNVEITANDEIR